MGTQTVCTWGRRSIWHVNLPDVTTPNLIKICPVLTMATLFVHGRSWKIKDIFTDSVIMAWPGSLGAIPWHNITISWHCIGCWSGFCVVPTAVSFDSILPSHLFRQIVFQKIIPASNTMDTYYQRKVFFLKRKKKKITSVSHVFLHIDLQLQPFTQGNWYNLHKKILRY